MPEHDPTRSPIHDPTRSPIHDPTRSPIGEIEGLLRELRDRTVREVGLFARTFDLLTLGRWLVLSFLVGIVAGLGACLFYVGLDWARYLAMEQVAGVHPPLAGGEVRLVPHAVTPLRWYLVLLLPAAGGLLSGLLVFSLAPEAEGHGTDAMIRAFHRKGGQVRRRVPFVKAVASILTIGTGGSAGREGPIAQIGAGFGSALAGILGLPARERRLLLLAGTAGGIGAIFQAPLGGALVAVEVLYRDDLESDGLVPCIVSSVTAYSVFRTVFGQGRTFSIGPTDFRPSHLLFYALLGVCCAVAGRLFVRAFYGARDRVFRPMPLPAWLKPAVGGLALGALGLAVPQVFGVGYGWMQLAIDGALAPSGLLAFVGPAAFLLLIALLKMVATAATIGSGGSGGVFGPSLYIGAMIGASFGLALRDAGVAVPVGAFALVGMGGFFAGVAHTPISTLIMVTEMAGSYDLLVPLMLVCGIAYVASRGFTLYEEQVPTRLDSPAHVGDVTVDLLESLRVESCMRRAEPPRVARDTAVGTLIDRLAEGPTSCAIVAGADGRPVGLVELGELRAVLGDEPAADRLIVAGDAMVPWVAVARSDTLAAALQVFLRCGQEEIPVVAAPGGAEVAGVIGRKDLMRAYHQELLRRRQAT